MYYQYSAVVSLIVVLAPNLRALSIITVLRFPYSEKLTQIYFNKIILLQLRISDLSGFLCYPIEKNVSIYLRMSVILFIALFAYLSYIIVYSHHLKIFFEDWNHAFIISKWKLQCINLKIKYLDHVCIHLYTCLYEYIRP